MEQTAIRAVEMVRTIRDRIYEETQNLSREELSILPGNPQQCVRSFSTTVGLTNRPRWPEHALVGETRQRPAGLCEAPGTKGQGADGLGVRRGRLTRYMTRTPDDLAELNEALAAQRIIDEGQWGELRQAAERFLR